MYFLPQLFCRHDLFTFYKVWAWVDDTFLVPNESLITPGETARNDGLK